MSRRLGPIFALLLAVSGGCSRGSSKAEAAGVGAVSPTVETGSPPAPRLASAAVFSAPIAATRAHRELVVAGLVAAEGVIRVAGLKDGGSSWTVDALRGVAWIPDAELKVQPAGDGVALVWRGNLDGKAGATLAILGPHGEPRGAPISIGAGSCATSEGIAWIDPRGSGVAHVRARRWDEPVPRDVLALDPDRVPTLLCGDHAAFVVGDGDDDLTASAFSPGAGVADPPVAAIRDRDFAADDEREHETFTVGDDLAVVRLGDSGAIAMREISHGHASPWRRLKHALSEADDVVAVDGDAAATVIVFTREAADACPGAESSAQTVRALRVDRKTGEETVVLLAPADCASTPGPFWLAASPGDGALVAWTHRRSRPGASAAPVDGLAYRALSISPDADARADAPAVRAGVEAEALAEAGCDADGCFVAALLRGPDDDGGRPEAIVGVRYSR
jgi:hypothetical protein